jgi:hypothetical protein
LLPLRSRRRHFLIWLSETERMSEALRNLAVELGEGPLAEATIDALRAAHRDAAEGVGGTAFRFRPPPGAERLMTAAATAIRTPHDRATRTG